MPAHIHAQALAIGIEQGGDSGRLFLILREDKAGRSGMSSG
jgi:hypothetical protein